MATTADPIDQDNELVPAYTRRPALLLAVAAGMCWACALAMLLSATLESAHYVFASIRVIYYILVFMAGVLTFVPFQRRLNLPGLAFEGISGSFLLLYTLAFVPAPSAWLLSPPDAPVYFILALAVFWSVSASVMPLIHSLGQRIFQQRARQFDLRRAWRQSHEFGALAALCIGLAGLRVLMPLPVVLLALILAVAELLFLSFVETAS